MVTLDTIPGWQQSQGCSQYMCEITTLKYVNFSKLVVVNPKITYNDCNTINNNSIIKKQLMFN